MHLCHLRLDNNVNDLCKFDELDFLVNVYFRQAIYLRSSKYIQELLLTTYDVYCIIA
jgi:hypothetical protein